jgi:trimeric autotransporter adhesin
MIASAARVVPRNAPRGAATAAPGSQPEEAFARALRQKGLAADDFAAGDDASGDDGVADKGGSPVGLPAFPPGTPATQPALSGAAGAESTGEGAAVTAAAAATSAAAATDAASIFAPTADEADPGVWEASIRNGDGVALDLRAESAASGPGGSSTWTVTVVAPALSPAILARHAPDLSDRLRRRGIAARVRGEPGRQATDEST